MARWTSPPGTRVAACALALLVGVLRAVDALRSSPGPGARDATLGGLALAALVALGAVLAFTRSRAGYALAMVTMFGVLFDVVVQQRAGTPLVSLRVLASVLALPALALLHMPASLAWSRMRWGLESTTRPDAP